MRHATSERVWFWIAAISGTLVGGLLLFLFIWGGLSGGRLD